MAVFHVARLVDLRSALFEILKPNVMLVSPFERLVGLTARLLQNYPYFLDILLLLEETFSAVLFKLNNLS